MLGNRLTISHVIASSVITKEEKKIPSLPPSNVMPKDQRNHFSASTKRKKTSSGLSLAFNKLVGRLTKGEAVGLSEGIERNGSAQRRKRNFRKISCRGVELLRLEQRSS